MEKIPRGGKPLLEYLYGAGKPLEERRVGNTAARLFTVTEEWTAQERRAQSERIARAAGGAGRCPGTPQTFL